TTAPTSTITSPVQGATVESGARTTISGTATDVGGVVGGVEVSVDGGATWHGAKGTSTWTYEWLPTTTGTAIIYSRATDDSGNIGSASVGVLVTVGPSRCPCANLWNHPTTVANDGLDASAIEVGVKFSSDIDGFITGIWFYKNSL